MEGLSYDRKKKASEEKKRLREEARQKTKVSSHLFAHDGNSFTNGGMPILNGSVCLCADSGIVTTVIKCCGYMVSLFPKDNNLAVIVLQLPAEGSAEIEEGGGFIPCICPTALINDATINTSMRMMEQFDKRRDLCNRSLG